MQHYRKFPSHHTTPQLDRQPETEYENTEVFCDHCIDESLPALKACLKCEVSLCARHFQRHQEKESFRMHNEVEPRSVLGLKACAIHRHPLEFFCSGDMTLLCAMCFIEGHHQSHDVLTSNAAGGVETST